MTKDKHMPQLLQTNQITQLEYLGTVTTHGRPDRSGAIQQDNLESKAAQTGVLHLPSGSCSSKQTKAYHKAQLQCSKEASIFQITVGSI